MTAPATDPGVARLYEGLSRFQWWCRRLGQAAPGAALELHKRLTPAGETADGDGTLHDWLRSLVQLPENPAVLDVGCGFGATLLHWARQGEGRFVGLSLSEFQIDKARDQARRLGVTAGCEFRVQSYDDPIEGTYDWVVSVESLVHAPDLARTLRHLSECVKPGGGIVLLEDMAVERSALDAADAELLAESWSTAPLYTVGEFRAALAGAGFELGQDVDLTGRVRTRPRSALDRQERWLRRVRRLTWGHGRQVARAFLGGVALERLYERGQMQYRAMTATRGNQS